MNNIPLFQFIELASLIDGRPFDGLAFGTFTDMMGRDVKLDPKDANEFIANTNAAIEATRSEDGEIVGLPIDSRNHDKGLAAGWIVGVELAGDVIRMIPQWTEIGMDLISKGIMRFFSPTVNLGGKVISGGSLTNWPATTDKKGRVLLRPIELSGANLHTYEVEPMSDKTEIVEEVVVATPDDVQPEPATDNVDTDAVIELAVEKAINKTEVELAAKYEAIFEQRWAQRQREGDIAEFSQGLFDNGFPTKADELTAFLSGLNTKQYDAAKVILSNVAEHGITDFGSKGHSGRVEYAVELEAKTADVLRKHVADGGTVDEWFEDNKETLGDKSQYNLAEFEVKQ